jgi:hypothetical protein
MVVGLGLLAGQILGWFGEEETAQELRRAVFPLKKRPQPAALAVEYHYDRNAVVDSRLLGSRILGLSASGNLTLFDADSYALRGERLLPRRATCLGPAEAGHVLVGIANGCIVRVATEDLAIERVDDVPGIPRWIGKRSKNGGVLVAYQSGPRGPVRLKDTAGGRTHELGSWPVLFLDGKDGLWIGSERVQRLDLDSGVRTDVELKGGWPGLAGFAELSDGQVWAFGGKSGAGETSSFIARVAPGTKAALLFAGSSKRPEPGAPGTPITHVLEATEQGQVMVVSRDSVLLTDLGAREWKPLEAMAGGRRMSDSVWAFGQAHRTARGLLLNLARGGFMEVTADYRRRHLLEGQYAVSRPWEIVRLEKGVAFFGDGGPSFYAGGAWRALPDPIVPSVELLGLPRSGETERVWAAMLTIPIDGDNSYVVAKAGPPRHYVGHIHGLRDTFLTARWDGKVLTTLGREDLPIEPADTFATPDRRLWNVDDQGLWSFSGGRWKLVMRSTLHGAGAVHATGLAGRGQAGHRSAIGEPLHFAASAKPPFYGLPTSASSWALVRLDKNDEGGVPLIDEVPAVLDGRRLLIHDLVAWDGTEDELLLATDHGLCLFNVKYATCQIKRPEGLGDQVTMFMRDRARRLWLAGRGVWLLAGDLQHAVPVHASVPMLSNARVVAMAEAPDGRVVLGLEDRGVIFLAMPERWLDGPHGLPSTPAAWEGRRPHEPSYQDGSIVLRACRVGEGSASEGTANVLLSQLRAYANRADPRTRVEIEPVYDGPPDIAVRGTNLEKLQEDVLSVVAKYSARTPFAAWRRQGPRGTAAVQVKFCGGT